MKNIQIEAIYQKCKMFHETFDDLPYGAFFALAEEQGIDVDDWAIYVEEHESCHKK